jgi:hypothetical protein
MMKEEIKKQIYLLEKVAHFVLIGEYSEACYILGNQLGILEQKLRCFEELDEVKTSTHSESKEIIR